MNGIFPVPDRRRWLVLASCCLSLFLVMMDVTVVNVVLPAIRRDFNADISGLQWIVDAYSLTVAALLMAAGGLADRVGRRRIFLFGIVIFCGGSVLCGMAATTTQMVMARIFQGVGGAMLNPVALAIIANTFLNPRERAQAIGIWGMMSGVALALGPLVGGFLADSVGWRAVFWVNLPVGALAFAMTWRFIGESKSPEPLPLDLPGQFLAATAVGSLTALLIEAPGLAWRGPLVIGLLVAALVGLAGFVVVEKTRARPMLDLRFFRSIPFASATLLAVMAFAVFSSTLFLNAIYLQTVRGLSPHDAGLRLMPFALCVMLAAPLSGRLVASHGARLPLLVSGGAFALGAWRLTALEATTSDWQLALSYALVGCGFGLCNAPITNAAVAGMPRHRAGLAAAVASTSRQIGASLGVAIAGTARGGATQGEIADRFLSAAHPVFWLATGLGVCIILCGIVATGRRARESAARVAAGLG